MAEVALRAELSKAGLGGRVIVDSAGTGDWHVGDPMNHGAKTELKRRGYDGSGHRARQFDARWLADRDLVLAMDASNLATLRLLAARAADTPEAAADADRRIRLFGEVAGLDGADVPDPYGEGPAAFARVLDMLETGMGRIVAQLRNVVGTTAHER
jgi:protein-tyrosine phosphatase